MQIVHIRKSKKFTKIYYIIYSVASVIAFGFSTPTFAESLPTTVSIKPSLSINIPSSTVNLVLDPSMNDFGSSSTTITVATNNPNGYKLYLSSSTTDLTNTTDNTYTIPTLSSSTSEANFPANYWGYKLNSDAATNYLPYQSDTLVSESTTATNGTSSTATFAAKVDYNKPAGLYSIAFDLKTIPIVTQVYMQDMTAEQCTETPTIVIDKRDEQIYTIRRIGDAGCWMIDNLRFGYNENNPDTTTLTLKPEDSNVTEERTIIAYDIAKYGTYENKCDLDVGTTMLGYITPCMHTLDTANDRIGIWYNYAAASAGTIVNPIGTTNTTEATESICPKNWKLPSYTEVNNTISAVGQNMSIFNPVVGGGYYNTAPLDTTLIGRWWSSTYSVDSGRYTLAYDIRLTQLTILQPRRASGQYVRCILQE